MRAVQRMCREGGWTSLMMFTALLLQWLWKSSWTEERETHMILSAPLTILCRAFLFDILQLSTMSRYNTSEHSPPHHCRKSWGCLWGERLVSASSGNTVSAGPVSWSLRYFYSSLGPVRSALWGTWYSPLSPLCGHWCWCFSMCARSYVNNSYNPYSEIPQQIEWLAFYDEELC